MIAPSRSDYRLLLRNDLRSFLEAAFGVLPSSEPFSANWHIDAVAWHLQQCAERKIRRLLITMPPRSLKSISASIAFPAWVLGRAPQTRFLNASYSERLAIELSNSTRALMNSEMYRSVFPDTKISAVKNTESRFDTTRGGYRFATSVGGTLTGMGGDFIVVDDPLAADDGWSEAKRAAANEWFTKTLYTRLNDKAKGVIIVVMQRLHAEDLAGLILRRGGWDHLNLPAIATGDERIATGRDRFYTRRAGELLHPEREPQAVLDDQRETMGSTAFAAQFQQDPIPSDGEIIKWAWFQLYDTPLVPEPGDKIIQSWDTASKAGELNDYSACTTWRVRNNRYFLIDVLRQRLDFPALRKMVIDHSLHHCADTVIIENKGSGISLIQDLRSATGGHCVIEFEPVGDKEMRMATASLSIEQKQVFLPRDAHWLSDFRSEILQFPKGRYDDQVDSLSQFLTWAKEHRHVFNWDFGNGRSGGDWRAPSAAVESARTLPVEPVSEIADLWVLIKPRW